MIKTVNKKVASNQERKYTNYAGKYAKQVGKFANKPKKYYILKKYAQKQQGTMQESLQLKWKITRQKYKQKKVVRNNENSIKQ